MKNFEVQLPNAEQGPQDFSELIGSIELADNVFVLATHGREIPVLSNEQHEKLNTIRNESFSEILQSNFTDFATYGNEETPGVTLYYPKDRMLVSPSNPRMVGDGGRNSDSVRYTPAENGKPNGQDNIRSQDFMLLDIFGVEPSEQQMEEWMDAEYGPRQYHQAVKDAYRAVLEKPGGPVVLLDVHDTSEWGLESASDESATSMVYRTDPDGWSAGFPTAVVSDLDGAASIGLNDAEMFAEDMMDAYAEVGVEPGRKNWGPVEANSRFKGGYITKLLGTELRQELIDGGRQDLADKIIVLQVELNRTNMLDDATQTIDPAAAYIEAGVIAKAVNTFAKRATVSYQSAKAA